jgi:flagellar basal-body rod modification protein FlgD
MSTLTDTLSQIGNSASSALSQLGVATPSTTSSTTPASSSTATTAAGTSMQSLAGNFDTFLQLLTTQLKNQDPLSPLDTNQFTQELVEFASVEQQVNTNSNLQTLITLQQTTEATSAMQFLGTTVTANGSTATLSNATGSPATWSINSAGPATANITITNSSGQTAFTGTATLNAGTQTYAWNGKGNSSVVWPDGNYTLTISATGANGQPVTVSTQVQGVVTGINLSQNPPQLTVGGQSIPINQIQSISR